MRKEVLYLVFLFGIFLIPFTKAVVSHPAGQIIMPGGGSLADLVPQGVTMCTSVNTGDSGCVDDGIRTELDPKVGAITNSKWCVGSSNTVVCNQDAPTGYWTSANGGIQYSSGNVGIGQSSPSTKLQVTGAGSVVRFDGNTGAAIQFEQQNGFQRVAFDQLRFWDWGGGSDMVIFNDGKVGIGTTTPAYPLSVVGIATSWQSADRWIVLYPGSDTTGIAWDSSAPGLDFFTWDDVTGGGYSNKLMIGSNGNVGIGTTTPAQKLEVNGRVRIASTEGIEFGSSTYRIYADGNAIKYWAGANGHTFIVNGGSPVQILSLDDGGSTLNGGLTINGGLNTKIGSSATCNSVGDIGNLAYRTWTPGGGGVAEALQICMHNGGSSNFHWVNIEYGVYS